MTIQALKPYSGKYKTISRWIKIRFNVDGNAYFIWRGIRYKFEEIMRLHYPIMYNHDDKIHYISGVYVISNTMAILIELDDCCEYVRVWQELED